MPCIIIPVRNEQVRHVERLKSRVHQNGRRSNEEHQRYLMIQKKRFEAVVTDSLTGPPLPTAVEGAEEGANPASESIPTPQADTAAVVATDAATTEAASTDAAATDAVAARDAVAVAS